VEETTAVTHRLANEADGLSTLVARFVTDRSSAPARPAQRSAPAAAGSSSAARPSPAKAMVNKVRQAFATQGSAAVDQEWSEF